MFESVALKARIRTSSHKGWPFLTGRSPPRIASLVTDKGEAMPDKDIPWNVESSHCMI